MSLHDIQKDVDVWTGQFTPQYWPPYEMLTHLMEELGEVAREINHLYGTKKKKAEENLLNLGQELTDILFTVCCIANSHRINLDEEWKKLMCDKQYGRDQYRFEKIKEK